MTVAATDSAVCQVTQFSISTAPISLSLVLPASTSSTSLTVMGSGVCQGLDPAQSFSLTATAPSTAGPPTCTDLAGVGWGQVLYRGGTYGGPFVLAAPTAGGVTVLTMTSFAQPGNFSSVFELNLSVASLEACATGGTTSLQYTGIAALAFT